MKIASISFKNFKYVTKDALLKIDLDNSESLILGGPNGYGKTTVFDAIELLITGEIRHFNPSLPNNRKENYSILANDLNADIYISAKFQTREKTICVERVFLYANNFDSIIKSDGKLITNNDLFLQLGINKNLFELGIYISQMDSLNFLQQKYKARKESITGVLDSTAIETTYARYKEVENSLKKMYEDENNKDTKKLELIKSNKETAEKDIKKLQLSQENIAYTKLFQKRYNFDKEFFDENDVFEVLILPVDELIFFSKNYSIFNIKKRNTEINETLSFDKNVFVALFYEKEISSCLTNKIVLDFQNELGCVSK